MKIPQKETGTNLNCQWKELVSSTTDPLIIILSEDRKIKE